MVTDSTVASIVIELRNLVDELALTTDVVRAVLPEGRPHEFESELWDYKEKLPSLPERANDDDKRKYKAELGDLIKDVVAFHNAFGGYIVFGIADKGRVRVRGCSAEFDCGDFNKRLQSYTDTNIECLYKIVPLTDTPAAASVGLLLVPRRAPNAPPVKFRKKGPDKPNGGRCFNEETYIRVRDECRPATATSSDWHLIHSARTPPEKQTLARGIPIKSSLPARDPDLVKFVGREEALASLRNWVTDRRSPVRLVTGIGGLGKTTLAYRFAEEMIETGAGDVEWVIWLTAKRQTYSALRGALVATGKVDFTDLPSLYEAILKALSYEMPLEEEDPSLDEVTDRLVEALCTYSCLLVVDDIDSLTPNEQRETVAALNALALRTVGREIAPSRVLMTSRIDQGLPPTSVVKILGLDRSAFDAHVANLCVTFGIKLITGATRDNLFDATSGSPLFAASIVRLVKLGENVHDVTNTWRGQEGEDVRRFAFERELKRLDPVQGRLLYSVLLLGETSVSDLAGILELTPKIVRDRVSELQAYHLISTSHKETGDAVIVAPHDLLAVTALLRTHLGSAGSSVEAACARAQERSSTDSRTIGAGIRRVLAEWSANRPNEALILAQELRKKFTKSGDVANVLGQAFMKVSPPRFGEADREFGEARRLRCARPELLVDTIRVKTELQDWQGLYQLTRQLISNEAARDMALSAFLIASEKLIDVAKVRGDHARAAELAIEAVERITSKTSRLRLEPTFFANLSSRRFDFAREYIVALDRQHYRAGDKLRVFEGVVRLAEAEVMLSDLLRVGVKALRSWWSDVEQRPVVDLVACSILGRQLGRLENLERQFESYSDAHRSLVAETEQARRDLAHRGAKLCS